MGDPDNKPIEGGLCRDRAGRGAGCHNGCSPGSLPRLIEGHQDDPAPFQQEGAWFEKSICCGRKSLSLPGAAVLCGGSLRHEPCKKARGTGLGGWSAVSAATVLPGGQEGGPWLVPRLSVP